MTENRLQPILAVIVPCFNEDEVLNDSAQKLLTILEALITKSKIHPNSFFYFVDDGSRDRTWDVIQELNHRTPQYQGLKLAHNAGHQKALLAGMLKVKNRVDCVVTIDADLQDDITMMESMIDHYANGFDVVYGVRKERKSDSIFKRLTAEAFYRIMHGFGVDVIPHHADFRLANRRVLDALERFQEVNLFLRGLFPLIGFRSAIVTYNRKKRLGGTTKYPFFKMLAFAVDGITSFSIMPIRVVTAIGFVVCGISFGEGIWAFLSALKGNVLPGWTSIAIPIFFLGGIQLLSIGLIGEYIGKIYYETKRRPPYIIDQELK